jgi:hypothetical protein
MLIRRSRIPTRAFFGAALLLALFSCNFTPQPNGTAHEEALVLRTYDVPGAYSAEVGGMIRRLLKPNGDDKPALGSASIGPGGKLLVAAPDGIQEGVQQLVQALHAKLPPPPATVTIEMWVVAGRPAQEASGLKELGEAAPALESVMKKEGAMEVALIEKLSLTSISGQHASTFGANVKLSQVATVIDDSVLADIDIDPVGPHSYSTRVELANGRMLVLGQAGYIANNHGLPFFDEGGDQSASNGKTLFYIVRAAKLPQGTGS